MLQKRNRIQGSNKETTHRVKKEKLVKLHTCFNKKLHTFVKKTLHIALKRNCTHTEKQKLPTNFKT